MISSRIGSVLNLEPPRVSHNQRNCQTTALFGLPRLRDGPASQPKAGHRHEPVELRKGPPPPHRRLERASCIENHVPQFQAGGVSVVLACASALTFKRENGQPTSHPPLGFRVNGNRRRMVPIPAELEIVEWILDRWRSGLSYRAIAAKLNENGAPTKHGTRWYHTTIVRIVQRREWYETHLSRS